MDELLEQIFADFDENSKNSALCHVIFALEKLPQDKKVFLKKVFKILEQFFKVGQQGMFEMKEGKKIFKDPFVLTLFLELDQSGLNIFTVFGDLKGELEKIVLDSVLLTKILKRLDEIYKNYYLDLNLKG